MIRVLTFALCGLASTVAHAADLSIGDPAPALQVTEWVKGQAVELAGGDGTAVVVMEFWATWCGPCIESIPHLTKLQRTYGNRGLRVIGVTAQDGMNSLEQVRAFVGQEKNAIDYTIAFESHGKTTAAYMAASGQAGLPTVFIVDQQRRVAWIGHPLDMSDRLIESILGGTHDLVLARSVFEISQKKTEAQYSGDWHRLLALEQEHATLEPGNTQVWVNQFHINRDLLGHQQNAIAVAEQAMAALDDNASALARVAGEMARSQQPAPYLPLAERAIARAVELAPTAPDVRREQVVVLAAGGKVDEALEVAGRTIQLLKDDAEGLVGLARVLSAPGSPARCHDLALQAVDRAIAADPSQPQFLRSKFDILWACKKDKAEANRVGRYFVESVARDDALLNDFAWELLTESDLQGEFNELALLAADRANHATGGKNWMVLDTLALAKFENGRIDEAIALEQKALEACGDPNARADLAAQLHRFKQAQD